MPETGERTEYCVRKSVWRIQNSSFLFLFSIFSSSSSAQAGSGYAETRKFNSVSPSATKTLLVWFALNKCKMILWLDSH